MKYILLLILSGQPPAQIGPFEGLFACETAAAQVAHAYGRARTACLGINRKPVHWNGKELKK